MSRKNWRSVPITQLTAIENRLAVDLMEEKGLSSVPTRRLWDAYNKAPEGPVKDRIGKELLKRR